MDTIDVIFRLKPEVLPTILACVKGEAVMVGMAMTPADARHAATIVEVEARAVANRKGGYRGAKKNKGISARDLILETLEKYSPSRITTKHFERAFEARIFGRKSYTGELSKMCAEGLVVRVKRCTYALPRDVPQPSLV